MDRQARWNHVMPYRDRLIAVAYRSGAGADAEDVVNDALLTAVTYEDLDVERTWPFLVRVVQRRLVDQHRRNVREQSLRSHGIVVQQSRPFEDDIADRSEAQWAAGLLAKSNTEVAELMWHLVGGATLHQLAAQRGLSTSALQSRVWRALRSLRSRIAWERKR